MTVVDPPPGRSELASARNAGAVAVANSAWVVFVSAVIVELACPPPPMTTAFDVRDAALVTHVGQESVLVDSDNGELNVAVKSLIAGCAPPRTPEVEILVAKVCAAKVEETTVVPIVPPAFLSWNRKSVESSYNTSNPEAGVAGAVIADRSTFVPSDVKLDIPPSDPEALRWTCVFNPPGVAVAVIAWQLNVCVEVE